MFKQRDKKRNRNQNAKTKIVFIFFWDLEDQNALIEMRSVKSLQRDVFCAVYLHTMGSDITFYFNHTGTLKLSCFGWTQKKTKELHQQITY